MTNNDVLKKLRIALDLKEADLFTIFALTEHSINKAELSGYFRKPGHKNYKECSDEVLQAFLDGYIVFRRGPKDAPADVEEAE
ncbi:DUF1456 family protein [Marinobacterium rhizophilum]|uniref:DUF1456 family protein n=1 Tax=Marinobacterium rhizophilum TaxID=420402 RepID=A0ABY5HJB5_9GAMM|nr:DUF1456 family protein [Marinobacterium rhizophilum]UTW12204.1 DUF1456 family protein [Marinobacterium rhizophilum]